MLREEELRPLQSEALYDERGAHLLSDVLRAVCVLHKLVENVTVVQRVEGEDANIVDIGLV